MRCDNCGALTRGNCCRYCEAGTWLSPSESRHLEALITCDGKAAHQELATLGRSLPCPPSP